MSFYSDFDTEVNKMIGKTDAFTKCEIELYGIGKPMRQLSLFSSVVFAIIVDAHAGAA